jgi:hypothetical protein
LGALRQTVLQSAEVYLERQHSRGHRLEPAGWTAHPDNGDAGANVGCLVRLSFREGRTIHDAEWSVSEDRTTVQPSNGLATQISMLSPRVHAR